MNTRPGNRWPIDTGDGGLNSLSMQIRDVDSPLAGRLARLAGELQEGRQDELAHLDLQMVLNPDAIEAKAIAFYQHRPPWVSIIEWVRNVLVLFPIAFTWFGLSRAAAAYRALLEGNEELLKQPFLLLWEKGFPGLDWSLLPTFSQVAITDFIILLIVVAMTVLVHGWRDYMEDRAARKAAALRSHVERTLYDLSRSFAVERYRQGPIVAALQMQEAVGEFVRRSNQLLQELQNEREVLKQLAAEIEKRYHDLSIFTTGLTEGANDLLRYGRDVRLVYDRLQESVVQIGDQLEKGSQQNARLLAALDMMGRQSSTLLETNRTLAQSLNVGIRDLQSGASQSAANAQAIVADANELRQVAAALLEGDTNLRAALVEVAQGNKEVTDSLGNAVAKIVESTSKTDVAAGLLKDVSAQIVKLGESDERLATRFTELAEQQRNATNAIRRVLEFMASSASQLSQEVKNLSQENQRLADTQTDLDDRWGRFVSQPQGQEPAAPGRLKAALARLRQPFR